MPDQPSTKGSYPMEPEAATVAKRPPSYARCPTCHRRQKLDGRNGVLWFSRHLSGSQDCSYSLGIYTPDERR